MSKSETLNICLAGCGGMAAHYRHKYTQVPGARLYMLIAANEDTAKHAAQELGVEKWSTTFEDALSSEIDIIDISTPNHLHERQAVAALNAGKHVLLQKPIAPSVEEAQSIINAGRRNGRKAGMYMSMLDNPIYHDMKRIMEQGLLGRISSIHCRGAHRGGLSMAEDNWRKSVEKTGGGSFIQLAIHQINMVQYLLSDKVAMVAAFSKNMMCPNIGGDDVTSAVCEFESGTQGVFESAYCADQSMLSVYGSRGFISVYNDSYIQVKMDDKFQGNLLFYDSPGEIQHINTGLSFTNLYEKYNPYDQHIAFVEAIMHGEEAPVPAEVGLWDLKIVKAVYRSASENRFVNISEI